MALRNLQRSVLCVMLMGSILLSLPHIVAQPLPYYKSEKIIVGEYWIKNINTVQAPRILKTTQIGNASFNKVGNGYLLQYNNQGIAEYDTIVFTADGKIHAYALKNQFLRTQEDYFIAEPGETILLDVLDNDDSYSNIQLSGIPFEEGVHATIQQGEVKLQTRKPGLFHFFYTACDGSGNCDEAKVTIFVVDPSNAHDTIVLSEVVNQQLTLPLPDEGFELDRSSLEHVYPDGEGFFDVDFFRQDQGVNEILFRRKDGKTLLYMINYSDKWDDNKLNTSDKVYVHPGKSAEISLSDNDFWVNIYDVLPTSGDIQVIQTGGGRVKIQPKSGFAGKTSFQYVTCAYPRCDTTTVDVYVDPFKPARDQFDIFVDPSVAYHIPFYTPSQDYQLVIEKQPGKGSLELTDEGHSMIYTPQNGYSGEDKAKIRYSYQTNDGKFESTHYIRFLPSPHPFRGKCTDCVWPGDTDENGVVDMADAVSIARYIGEKGPVRSEGTVWKGQWNYPWLNFEHDKLNHIDADGTGLISWEDLQVIVDFYGKTHGMYSSPLTWLDIPVVVDRSKQTVSPGDQLVFEFNIGDKDHKLYNVTGFSTDIKIDGHNLKPTDVEVVRDENNWLKSHQPTMSLKAAGSDQGQVSAGEYRVRSVGVKGYGTALKLSIIVEDEVEGFRSLRAKSNGLKFIFRDLKIHTTNGVISLPDQTIEVPLEPAEKTKEINIEQPQVFPNPAQDEITVQWPSTKEKVSLEVVDLTGKRHMEYKVNTKVQELNINLENIAPGLYILRCVTGDKVWNQKLTIVP